MGRGERLLVLGSAFGERAVPGPFEFFLVVPLGVRGVAGSLLPAIFFRSDLAEVVGHEGASKDALDLVPHEAQEQRIRQSACPTLSIHTRACM